MGSGVLVLSQGPEIPDADPAAVPRTGPNVLSVGALCAPDEPSWVEDLALGLRGAGQDLRSFFRTQRFVSYHGDARTVLREFPSGSVDCVVTSPPYFSLRRHLTGPGEIDHEATVEAYVERLAAVGRELLRVVKRSGSVWLILGDTCRRKEWLGIPWRVAFAMGDVGWRLRNEVIWTKPPDAATAKDQLGSAHEQMFHFTRGMDAYYDMDAIRDHPASPRTKSGKGRAPTDVWFVPPEPTEFRDFAVVPEALVERPILATCPRGGTVLDPFLGSGTTAAVALQLGRSAVGIDFSSVSLRFSKKRVQRLLELNPARKRPVRRPRGNR